jgi:hypothetical protein
MVVITIGNIAVDVILHTSFAERWNNEVVGAVQRCKDYGRWRDAERPERGTVDSFLNDRDHKTPSIVVSNPIGEESTEETFGRLNPALYQAVGLRITGYGRGVLNAGDSAELVNDIIIILATIVCVKRVE